MSAIAAVILSCQAIDGDTLRCGDERYRLLGIDAPELPGHCRNGRACAPGNPLASRTALAALVAEKLVRIEVIGRDRYGRFLAIASVGERNLSCAQIESGNATYIAKWDNGSRIRKICPT